MDERTIKTISGICPECESRNWHTVNTSFSIGHSNLFLTYVCNDCDHVENIVVTIKTETIKKVFESNPSVLLNN